MNFMLNSVSLARACICMCMCVCVRACVRACVRVCVVCVCVCVRVLCACMRACARARACVCVCVCVCVRARALFHVNYKGDTLDYCRDREKKKRPLYSVSQYVTGISKRKAKF